MIWECETYSQSLGREVVVCGLLRIRWVSEKLKWNEPNQNTLIFLAWLAGCLIGLLTGWWVCFVWYRLVFAVLGQNVLSWGCLLYVVWDCLLWFGLVWFCLSRISTVIFRSKGSCLCWPVTVRNSVIVSRCQCRQKPAV